MFSMLLDLWFLESGSGPIVFVWGLLQQHSNHFAAIGSALSSNRWLSLSASRCLGPVAVCDSVAGFLEWGAAKWSIAASYRCIWGLGLIVLLTKTEEGKIYVNRIEKITE